MTVPLLILALLAGLVAIIVLAVRGTEQSDPHASAGRGGVQEAANRAQFRKGLLWSAIPVGVLSLLSTGGVFTNGALWVAWYLALLVWIIGFFVVLGFALARRGQIATGILAGLGLGFLALFVSCFANVVAIGNSGGIGG